MNHPKLKICPRCESNFECKVSSIAECKCSSVFLTKSEQEYVAERYNDCVCLSCMIEVQAEFSIQNNVFAVEQSLRH